MESDVLCDEDSSLGDGLYFVDNAICAIADALDSLVASSVLVFHQLLLVRGRGWLRSPKSGRHIDFDCMTENAHEQAFRRACSPELREKFWEEEAREVEWFDFPKTILDNKDPPFARWFPDGKINITHNMFDRFLPQHSNKQAVVWVSNMVKERREWTLQQAFEDTCRMARLLQQQGVQKGDRVIIYLPMIPEALFTTWACARIGAVHSIVFGGFADKELANRIVDSKPKAIVTTSCGLEPNKKVNYVDILYSALKLAEHDCNVLIRQRPDLRIQCDPKWKEFSIDQLPFEPVPCQKMTSTDYLYILYTSGTTGAPKGIVRDHGGTTVALNWTMNHIMDIHLGDTYFAASDIGWVVGHSFTVYGPLLRGSATVLYEGKPTVPNAGALWQIVEKYKVNGLYTSPTGLRALRREDNNGEWIDKYNTSSLRAVSMAGERCDIPTYEWIRSKLNVLINDNYWQTQCGWIISCNYKNLHTYPYKPGSATKPCPGFFVQVLNHHNEPVPRQTLGKVCVKLPMPPSFMNTLYNNDQAFLEKYMKETPGYYTTGDAGYFDKDGYLNVMTRLDDIINTAGHRLSTASMEEQLISHPSVSEAAVVAKIDELRGEIPIGLVVLKKDVDTKDIQKQLIALIRKNIGPVAFFHSVVVVEKLPKTRSGKILRNVLRKIIQGEPYRFPATIEDDSVLSAIEKVVKAYGKGLGQHSALKYRGDVDDLDREFSDEEHEIQESQGICCEPTKKVKENQP